MISDHGNAAILPATDGPLPASGGLGRPRAEPRVGDRARRSVPTVVRGPPREPEEPDRPDPPGGRAELGRSRRREAVAPLSALVRDPEVRVRLEVVRALGNLRDLSAIPALVTSLQDGDAGIREEAIGTIVEIYAERDRGGPIDRFLQTFSDEFDRQSVPPFTMVDPGVFRGLAGTPPGREDGHPGRVGLRDRHPRRGQRDPGPGGGSPGPRIRGPSRGGDRARQGRHGRGGQGAHPPPGRQLGDRAQPGAAGDRGAACPGRRARPARDVRAEPSAGARHARARRPEPHRRPRAGRPLPGAPVFERPGAPPPGRGGARADRRRVDDGVLQEGLPTREEPRRQARLQLRDRLARGPSLPGLHRARASGRRAARPSARATTSWSWVRRSRPTSTRT